MFWTLAGLSTCKQRFGQFGFFSASRRPKNGLTHFERHFLAKCPGVNGLNIHLNFIRKLSCFSRLPIDFRNLKENKEGFLSTEQYN